jgi:hypothetical protein
MPNDSTRVLIMDLATLRYRFAANRRSLSVLTSAGETLSSVTMRPAEEDTDVIFRALAEAGRTSCVLRADDDGQVAGHQLAFYNPLTAQVSWSTTNRKALFVPDVPLIIDPAGLSASIETAGESLELSVSGMTSAEVVPDATTVARTLSALR